MIFFHAGPLISRFSLEIYITLLQQLWQTVLVWNLYPIFISLNQMAVKITPAESFLWMHLHQFQYLFLFALVLNLAYIDYSLCQIWSVYMQYLHCCDHSNECLFLVIQQAEVLLNFFGECSCRWSKVWSKAGENNGLIRPPLRASPAWTTEIAPISSPHGVEVQNQTTLASPLGTELVWVIWLTPSSGYVP